MEAPQLARAIAAGESLECEFQSDRGRLTYQEIDEEVVALANSSSGHLPIGIEDDGAVTGARPLDVLCPGRQERKRF